MPLLVCCLCRDRSPVAWRGLCAGCLEKAAILRVSGDLSGRGGLFDYEGVVRDMIVQAKSRGDRASFYGCWQLFQADPRTGQVAGWADAIAAVPPSFWTRIRGRSHLGSMLAGHLSLVYRKPWLQIDSRIFWRIRKQALKSVPQRRAAATKAGRHSPSIPNSSFRVRITKRIRRLPRHRILIVDDVMTTGVTAMEVSCAVEQQLAHRGCHVEVRVLALAQSARADFTDCISLPQILESPSVQA